MFCEFSAFKDDCFYFGLSGDEILFVMVVYGFLSCFIGQLRIPNHELILKVKTALSSKELGFKQNLGESRWLLTAMLEQWDKKL